MVSYQEASNRLKRSVKTSIRGKKRKASTALFSALIFLLFAFTTDIPWHLQTLEAGIQYWDNALLNGITSIYLGGIFSLILTVTYSLISSIVLTNVFVQLKNSRISGKGLGSILPGFVATGCASCGVGLAGFIGLTGVATALPFQGDLLKAGGLMLLIYALYEMGDSGTCEA